MKVRVIKFGGVEDRLGEITVNEDATFAEAAASGKNVLDINENLTGLSWSCQNSDGDLGLPKKEDFWMSVEGDEYGETLFSIIDDKCKSISLKFETGSAPASAGGGKRKKRSKKSKKRKSKKRKSKKRKSKTRRRRR